VRPRYRQAKETKRGGRGGGESERRIVPWKRGNRPEGPRGGKEAPGHEAAGGIDARDTEPCYHLNRTTADSGQGRGREVAGEFVARRAGCLNWARPAPWGAEVGNRPGLPDRPRSGVNELRYATCFILYGACQEWRATVQPRPHLTPHIEREEGTDRHEVVST